MYGTQTAPPDLPLAVRLMRELADENPLAAHDLGVLLLKGMGCQADEDEAQRWFQKALAGFQKAAATEKKSAYFQYRVGKMYAMGYGTKQDYLEAALWYERATRHDNYCGECTYQNGVVTQENIPTGHEAIELGCDLWDMDPEEFLSESQDFGMKMT